MFWEAVRRFYASLNAIPKVSFALLGCGLARAWLWWMLSLVSYSDAFPAFSSHEGHFLFDLGEIIGFFLLPLLAHRFSPFFKRGVLVAAALALTLCCTAGTLVALTFPATGPYALLLIVGAGLGYAFLFLLWLELYGCLTARPMLIAWTGSYFLALLIWGLDQISLPGSLDIVWCLLPAASLFLLFKGFCLVSPQSLPVPMEHRPSVPWKLIVVLSAFALAFGLGDAVTGQNMFTWVSKVGMGIPELLVLLSVVFLYRQFSFRHLVTVAAPLVVAGLVGAFFVGQQAIPSFILMNAGSETYLILVYAVACITARKLGTSAVYLGGLFAGFYKVFLQVGKGAGLTVIGQVHDVALSTPILALAMVTMTIVASIALVQDRSIVDKFSWKEQSAEPHNVACARLTEQYHLTPREASVLLLLIKKRDTAHIAEELFLAQSTVRVHISSIYKKLDVHSRQELLARID